MTPIFSWSTRNSVATTANVTVTLPLLCSNKKRYVHSKMLVGDSDINGSFFRGCACWWIRSRQSWVSNAFQVSSQRVSPEGVHLPQGVRLRWTTSQRGSAALPEETALRKPPGGPACHDSRSSQTITASPWTIVCRWAARSCCHMNDELGDHHWLDSNGVHLKPRLQCPGRLGLRRTTCCNCGQFNGQRIWSALQHDVQTPHLLFQSTARVQGRTGLLAASFSAAHPTGNQQSHNGQPQRGVQDTGYVPRGLTRPAEQTYLSNIKDAVDGSGVTLV